MRLGWREVACKQSTPPRTPARASRFVSRTGLRDARNREGRTGAQRTDASRQRPPVEQQLKQNSELTRSSQTAMSSARFAVALWRRGDETGEQAHRDMRE